MPITSNLILKTSLPKPTGTGYSDVIAKLRTIDALLDKIAGHSDIVINIKYNVTGKPPTVPKGGGGSRGGGGGKSGGGKEPQGPFPNPRPRKYPISPSSQRKPLDLIDQTGVRTTSTTTFNKKGKAKTTSQEVREFQNLEDGILYTAKQTISAKGNQIKLEEKQVDLSKQRNQREQERLKLLQAQLAGSRAIFDRNEKYLKAQGYTEDTKLKNRVSSKALIEGDASTLEAIRRRKYVKADKNDPSILHTAEITDDFTKKKLELGTKENTTLQGQVAKHQKLLNEQEKQTALYNQFYKLQGYRQTAEINKRIELGRKGSGIFKDVKQYTFERQNPNNPAFTQIATTGGAGGGQPRLRSKPNTQYINQQNKQAENARRNLDIEQQAQSLLSKGYTRTADKLIRDSKGMQYSVQQFSRVSGNALHGYSVEVANINTLTGKTTAEILTGARAWKFLGDSVARSTVKVALWTAATSLVFGTIAAIKSATDAISELEAGTVLLARVGAGLGQSWDQRIKQAGELTNKIVELSVATSTSAVEGQKAAAVFLRTGQTQKEAVQSVTAALVASRIAELGVVEAANLLTAAQTQFNLSADQLIPTLDTLNELSNKYRVTTNDLLQAISRTGSVFEQQGGTLSQLASIIAVTAQTTARSGAEIGNAIKTVESRLANAENSDVLLQKTGIGFRNAAGEARALTDVLLDMQIAFYNMSQAEQDAVTISAAGVRQRNILLAQVNGAVDIIIAESRALRGDQDEYSKYGSAISEAAQTAGTLEAQVKKLQATFISMAVGASGPIISFLKSTVFALQKVLELFKAFGGAPAKLAAFAALVAVVNVAMHHMGINATVLKAKMVELYAVLSSGQLLNAAKGMAHFAAVLAGSIGPAVAVAAAIVLVTQAVTYLADRSAKASLLLELEASGHDAAAEHANKQRVAIVELTNAIGKQIQSYNQLNQAGLNAQRDLVGKGIKKLLDELQASGVKIPVDFDPKNPKKVAQLQVAAQLEANKKLFTAEQQKEKQVRNERRARDAKREDLFARRKLLQDSLNPDLLSNGLGASAALVAQGDLLKGFTGLGVDEEIAQITLELKKLEDGTDEDSVKIRKLQEELSKLGEQANAARLGESNALAVRESINRLDELSDKLRNIEKNSSQLKDIFGTLGISESFANSKQIEQTVAELDKMKTEMEFISKQDLATGDSELFNRLGDSMDKAAISLRDLTAEKQKFDATSIQKSLKELNDFDSKIDIARTGVDVIKSRVNLNPEQYSQKNNDLILGISERNRLIQQSESLLSKANTSTDPNVIASSKADAQARLTQATEKELEIQTAIYDKEKAIVEEKKKANEELQRSLGLLGEEDKARLLIQADYFNKNKGKLSIEQQFAASADTNKIAQGYFANRLESSDQARARGSALQTGPFGNLISKEIQDLNVQEAELARIRNRTDGARGRVTGNIAAGRRLAGEVALPNTDEGSIATPNLNVNMSGLDLEPLVSKFEEVAITRMDNIASDMIARLEALERKYTAPPRRAPVAAAAGGQ